MLYYMKFNKKLLMEEGIEILVLFMGSNRIIPFIILNIY